MTQRRRAYAVGLLSGLFAWLCILAWGATLVCLGGSLFSQWRWRWLILVVICSFVFEWLQMGFEANLRRMSGELSQQMAAQDAKA